MTSRFWQDRPVFVTGAYGLVGAATVRMLLERGANVVALERDRVPTSEVVQAGFEDKITVIQGDLSNAPLLERVLNEYEIKTVLHLAAQAIVGVANRNPVSTFESNVRGTWNLLEACRRSPLITEIVVASSDKAYGEQATLPYTEDMPLTPVHPYDVSKACTDLIAQSYAHTFKLPVTISRCGNFYGPGDLHWNRIVPGTMRSIIRGEAPVIRSDGTLIRDYFYVDDGAEAYLLLAEKMATNKGIHGHAFNFSNEEPFTVLEIADRVLRVMKSDLKLDVRNEVSGEILKQHLDASKAKNLLGWKPTFGLDEGLLKTAEWYKNFLKS